MIFDACSDRTSEFFYVGTNIPKRKLQNALSEFSVTKNESVFALVDTTVFGSAKQGALFTNKGIHVKNSWTGDMSEGFISWNDFQYAEFENTNRFTKKEVWMDNVQIEMSGASLTPQILQETLSFIQQRIQNYYNQINERPSENRQAARQQSKPATPPPPVQESWMVAIDGQQYGPYNDQTIIDMIQTNQVIGEKDFLWKQGMENWVPIKDCVPFNIYLAPTPPPLAAAPLVVEPPATDEKYTQVDVNEATISDLLSLPYFSLENSNSLLLKRKELGGRFQSIDQVQAVLALAPHEFEKLRSYLIITEDQNNFSRMGGRVIDY